jgi:hypothetical protein
MRMTQVIQEGLISPIFEYEKYKFSNFALNYAKAILLYYNKIDLKIENEFKVVYL